MERDENSQRRGYMAWSLSKILRKALPRIHQAGMIFQQDNAPMHSSLAIRNLLVELGIPTLVWPPYSPDLNPIEHAWRRLKDRIKRYHPYLEGMDESQEAFDVLVQACKKEWKKIGTWFFDRLVESMPRRLAAVRKARGWQIKY